MKWKRWSGFAVIVVLLTSPLFAATPRLEDFPSLPSLTPQDRIVILAPHEDDETLGTGGVVQRALSSKAGLTVIYLTHGDHNEWAFLLYRKSLWLTPRVNRQMGTLRRNEALRVLHYLGLSGEHALFLGFPDNGTLDIWEKHWGPAAPLLSLLTDTRSVPYADAVGYGRPYKGEELLDCLERELLVLKPTQIFVTHPLDSNPDHRAYYLFLQVALWDLEGRIPLPRVYCYPIHMGAWPRPLFFRPDQALPFPRLLDIDKSPWWTMDLTPAETQAKAEAIRMYRSQMADHGYWLISFARRNELFTTPNFVVLKPGIWTEECGLVPASGSNSYNQEISTGHPTNVSWRQTPRTLQVSIRLPHRLEEELGFELYVFGYKKGKPFARLPKIHGVWSLGKLKVFDQSRSLPAEEVVVQSRSTEVLLTFPWAMLGNPDRLLTQVRGLAGGIMTAHTSWRVLVRSE